MPRETLVDLFDDLAAARGDFLVYDDGFRARTYSYSAVAAAARACAARLQGAGVRKGDAVLLWSENRPEWVAAFWACVLAGAVAVPIDYRSSASFAHRVASIVGARLALIGEETAGFTSGAVGAAAMPLPSPVKTWRLSALDWADRALPAPVPRARDDVAEIIFTSGATAEPKGVLITHGNILANVVPIESEVRKYRRWGRPFFPLRFLNLLPLSHLFGQAMATFIPPMLPGTVVFMRGYNPAEIVRQVRTRRVSVVVCVPRILDVLGEYVRRLLPRGDAPGTAQHHWTRRWWHYRRVHRAFGLKFWSFVVGAAPLDPALEEFWSRLGFVVIQGYGLTETAPIVSLNHPFATQKGSVGKAIGGIQVRIAPDGEILVKGENVSRGYFGADQRENAQAFEDGWLRTGDVGEIDEHGQLFVRGRKKEMIVTPEGLNVFPEDVERVLDALPGVRESAVVGVRQSSQERVHAVLVLDDGIDAEAMVRAANAQLAEHQRIRGVSRWPLPELPRTDGTRKLKRVLIRQWVEGGRASPAPVPARDDLDALVGRFASGRAITRSTSFDELGLSSLERIELLVAVEERFGTSLDESRLAEARTVGDLQALVDQGGGIEDRAAETWRMPAWNRARVARWIRNVSLATWVLPLARLFIHLRVEGLEHLRGLQPPVVFAANHQSHMDTPAVFAALPARWRYRLAVAMAKEFFGPHFHPEGRSRRERAESGLLYALAALFFNAFPLPQREAGTRRTLRYMGELLGEGWSVLIYPEGERTQTGAIGPFRGGIGMVGSRLSVPIVPVRLEGLDRVLHRDWRMARPGRVRVAFGAPFHARGDDYAALAAQVEAAVRRL